MGTRGLTKVISGKRTVIAQYGQWDHYPSGQGVTILKFLRSFKGDFKKFKDRLMDVRFQTDEDKLAVDSFLIEIGSNNGWMDMEQSKKYQKKYPLLTRDNGGKILEMIMKSKEHKPFLVDASDFGERGGGFGCEYKYVIDLDKNTFKIYSGTSNLMKTYKLNQPLPTKAQFLKDLKDDND